MSQRHLREGLKALKSYRESWVLLLVALFYTTAYLSHANLPGNSLEHPRGWLGWWDQSKYQQSAAALAELDTSAGKHWYPPGYPLISSLGYLVAPNHAYYFVNLGFCLLAFSILWRMGQLGVSRNIALIAITGFISLHSSLVIQSCVVPWNTIPTMALLYAGCLLTLKPVKHGGIILSSLAGVTYLIRPADAAAFGPLLIYAVLKTASWRDRLVTALKMSGVLLLSWLSAGLLDIALHGQWNTPYEEHSKAIGIMGYSLASKVYWLMMDSEPAFFEPDNALLFKYPWLWLSIPAAYWWLTNFRWAALAVFGSMAGSWFVYFVYNDFWPTNIHRYLLIHYLFWTLPLLWLMIACAFAKGFRKPAIWLLTSVALFLAVLMSGLKHVPTEDPDNGKVAIYQLTGSADALTAIEKHLGAPYRDFFKYDRRDHGAIIVNPQNLQPFMAQADQHPDVTIVGYSWEWDLSLSSILQKWR